MTRARAVVLLAAGVLWAAWVAAHYFAWPLTRPALADGVLRTAFPFWREAALAAGSAMAGAAGVLVAAWGLGRVVLLSIGRATRNRHEPGDLTSSVERINLQLACGLAALSTLCLVLANLRVYQPAFLRGLVAAGVVAACTDIAVLRRAAEWLRAPGWFRAPARPALVARTVPWLCMAAALACGLVGALAPEIEYDALWYHLWLPQQWLEAGAPVDIVSEYVSLYPLFWQLLYGVAMTLGGPGAAKLLHFSCLPLLGSTTWLLARSLIPAANPYLAAALAMCVPTVIWEGTTAYSDLALAWYVALTVYTLLQYAASGRTSWLALGGITMGSALAVKHLALVALLAIVVVAMGYAVRAWRPGRGVLQHGLLFVALSLAIPAPWYARAAARSGNPVFPDLYAVFGARPPERWSADTQASLQRFKDRFGPERSVLGYALLPWDLSVHGARYGGSLGPLFLILVPWAFASRAVHGSARSLAAGGALYFAIWASPVSSFQMRFLLPLVPPLAVFAAAGAAALFAAAARLHPSMAPAVTALVSAGLLLNLPPFTRWHERDRRGDLGWLTHVTRELPGRVVLGAEDRDSYLDRLVPSFGAWRFLEEQVPERGAVLTFTGGDHLYGSVPRIWSDAEAALGVTWRTPAGHEAAARAAARRLGITHVLFDKNQLQSGSLSPLAIASPAMRACCLIPVYEDSRSQLFALSHDGR